MSNPYADLPDHAFWRRAVADRPAAAVDPVVSTPFAISPDDAVATAGSCFAQHISRALVQRGYHYLVTEKGQGESYGVFPARFANIYSVRQLAQLFDRAYGRFQPVDEAWPLAGGRWADPFRPRIEPEGFATREALLADREIHLAAVRAMFERCEVFIFTLGLTEAWVSTQDGAVFPLARGVVAEGAEEAGYVFHNFTVAEMTADLKRFIDQLREVNPDVKVILTVSPVPLIATYEPRHVLVSTAYSKAALRVVAEETSRSVSNTAYFPSYEIITGPHSRGAYFADDLREVTPEGVAQVMDVFARHFLVEADDAEENARHGALAGVICDEDLLDL